MADQERKEDSRSLVKYAKPVIVNSSVRKEGRDFKSLERELATTNTEDILNAILPPNEFRKNGHLYVESVLSTPATKSDVIEL